MKLEIGSPIIKIERKNTFKLVINFMAGDADSTKNYEIYIDENDYMTDVNKQLEIHYLLNTLDDVIKLDSRGRCGYDDLQDMLLDHYKNENLEHFLCDEYDDEIDSKHKTSYIDLMFEIPRDDTSDYYTSFSSYDLTYIDSSGVEHTVNIIN